MGRQMYSKVCTICASNVKFLLRTLVSLDWPDCYCPSALSSPSAAFPTKTLGCDAEPSESCTLPTFVNVFADLSCEASRKTYVIHVCIHVYMRTYFPPLKGKCLPGALVPHFHISTLETEVTVSQTWSQFNRLLSTYKYWIIRKYMRLCFFMPITVWSRHYNRCFKEKG